jgi:ribosomal subunit interface protein
MMHTTVSGKQIKIGAALGSYAQERIERGVHKFFDRAVKADVVFSKDGPFFRADIMVNEGVHHGIIMKSHAESGDVYAAFDSALLRIEQQLRRYKRKLRNHHAVKFVPPAVEEVMQGKKYVISPMVENPEDKDEPSNQEDNPVIIAEKSTPLERMTVSEAVMKMDLWHLPALMFINRASGRFNVVYHRKDGNISWIDPMEVA